MSAAVKARPASSGIPSVRKNPGVTLRQPAERRPPGGASAARSSGVTSLLNPYWRNGLVVVAPTDVTPGRLPTRSSKAATRATT